MTALATVKAYYQYFNEKNWEGMLSLLSNDVKHEANQGDTRVGKQLFAEFLAHMEHCYDEQLSDMVFFAEPTNTRVAVEFVVNGKYINTDSDLPEANGQTYVLPAGAFIALENDKIIRISTYYNLPLWMKLVGAE